MQVGIHKKEFVKKIKEKNQELASLFEEKDFIDWIDVLRTNRHFMAHQGNIMLSLFIKEPKGGITESMIQERLEKNILWQHVKNIGNSELLNYVESLLKHQIFISLHERIVDEASIIKDIKKNGFVVPSPMQVIDWHYNNLKDIIEKSANKLLEILATKEK